MSWCIFERDYDDRVLPIPWETTFVELEEGPLFVSNPQDFTWRDVEAGMPVTLNFIERKAQAGTFRLPVFLRP